MRKRFEGECCACSSTTSAEVAPRLVAIRAGTGLLDLANDLETLADFYEEEDIYAVISRDFKHWRKDDAAFARELAQAIFCGLGLGTTGDAAPWADLTQRAWTMLDTIYGDVCVSGKFVFRRDEDVELTYPSLVAATRSPAAGVREEAEPEAPPAAAASAAPPARARP